MVTASHNPPQDNGYKVYLGDGSQIVPPADTDIAAAHRPRRPASPTSPAPTTAGRCSTTRWSQAYLDGGRGGAVDPHGPRDLSIVHTRCTASGDEVVQRAFARRRLRRRRSWSPSQAEPDPRLPDGRLPEPRGAGRHRRGAGRSPRSVGADLVLANDPDADRCAVAVPDPRGQRGRPRRLADAARRRGRRPARGAPPGPRGGRGRGLRQLDRVLAAARGDLAACRGRAARGDADRVQVDRPRAGAALRLRGGPRLLRRPALGPGQGRGHRGTAARRAGRGPARRRGARCSTCSTTWPWPTGCTPPTQFSVRVADLALIADGDGAAALDPARAGSAGCR